MNKKINAIIIILLLTIEASDYRSDGKISLRRSTSTNTLQQDAESTEWRIAKVY